MFTVDLEPMESGGATVALCCDDEEALFLRFIAGYLIGACSMWEMSGRPEESSMYDCLREWSLNRGYKHYSRYEGPFVAWDAAREVPILRAVTLQEIRASFEER